MHLPDGACELNVNPHNLFVNPMLGAIFGIR
jgi:hypothetical protein